MTISVFMYHAIYSDNEELTALTEEDRPYAISLDTFRKQLDLLLSNEIPVLDANDIDNFNENGSDKQAVLLTFDDGHISFYKYAFPELLLRNLNAIFFVTSGMINDRKNFCDWKHLSEMVDKGMSVQSHGCSHNFISDMNAKDSECELADSKKEIENSVNMDVFSISFPGGRYSRRDLKLGENLGYKYFFTSDEGLNTAIVAGQVIRRMALRRVTTLVEYLKLAKGNKIAIAKRYYFYVFKTSVKKIIGNHFYHLLYKGLK